MYHYALTPLPTTPFLPPLPHALQPSLFPLFFSLPYSLFLFFPLIDHFLSLISCPFSFFPLSLFLFCISPSTSSSSSWLHLTPSLPIFTSLSHISLPSYLRISTCDTSISTFPTYLSYPSSFPASSLLVYTPTHSPLPLLPYNLSSSFLYFPSFHTSLYIFPFKLNLHPLSLLGLLPLSLPTVRHEQRNERE